MTAKTNIVKSVRCERCETVLHREDITENINGQHVDVLAYCPICGHYFVADRVPLNEAGKNKKGKPNATQE